MDMENVQLHPEDRSDSRPPRCRQRFRRRASMRMPAVTEVLLKTDNIVADLAALRYPDSGPGGHQVSKTGSQLHH